MIPATRLHSTRRLQHFHQKNFDHLALLEFSTDRYKIFTHSYHYIKEQYAVVSHAIFNMVAILNWSNNYPCFKNLFYKDG